MTTPLTLVGVDRDVPADAQVEPSRRRPRRLRRPRPTTWAALGFAAPLLVYLVVFYLYPLWTNVSLSVHRYTRATYVTGEAPYVGLDVYREVVADKDFWPIVAQTATFVLVSLVVQYVVGLALAVFFQKHFPLSSAIRALFLVPWLLPIIVSGTIWQWMMDVDSGVLNELLGLVGLDPIWWLQADNSLWAVILANIWLGIPFNLVILYAGLQNIPVELYEAASIDGASRWRQFWSITMPLLRPTSAITLLLGFVYTLKVVDVIWIMTTGTGTSRTLATYAYGMAFGKGTSGVIAYSEAAVVGTLLLVVALAMGFVYLLLQRRQEA